MKKKDKKGELITRKDLEEQTQIIIGAVDSILTKRLKEVNKKVDGLKVDFHSLQTLIDGYVKEQEDFKKDFVIIKEEVRQIKEIIKEKLGLEIKAI